MQFKTLLHKQRSILLLWKHLFLSVYCTLNALLLLGQWLFMRAAKDKILLYLWELSSGRLQRVDAFVIDLTLLFVSAAV